MSCGTAPDAANEDGEVLMPKRRPVRPTDPKLCFRCHSSPALYLSRSLKYCRQCFLSSIHQRFVRNLYTPLRPATSRKNSNMRPHVQSGEVLLAISGGAGSMTMLDHLMEGGMIGKGDGSRADKTKGEREVVWDKGTVVYVEFAGVTGMQDRKGETEDLARERGLGFVGLRAEDVFDDGLMERLGGPPGKSGRLSLDLGTPDLPIHASSSTSSSPLDRLRALLSSLSPASRPSLLSQILTHLLNLTATLLPNVSHLLLGESSTREAQRLISGTATGRGWALPLELAPALALRSSYPQHPGDEPSATSASAPKSPSVPGPVRIKPMKDISLKDAAIYCHLRKLPTVNQRIWADSRAHNAAGRGKNATSLEMLTEQFIAGLSVSHPSTVSTINKTGDKLVFPGDRDSEVLCPLCQMPAEPSAQAWKARTALTSLSNKLSGGSEVPNITNTNASDRPVVNIDIDNYTRSTSTRGLAPLLCYACLTTLTPRPSKKSAIATQEQDDDGLVDLPMWVGEHVRRRVGEGEMRAQIGGFLLDDGDGDGDGDGE